MLSRDPGPDTLAGRVQTYLKSIYPKAALMTDVAAAIRKPYYSVSATLSRMHTYGHFDLIKTSERKRLWRYRPPAIQQPAPPARKPLAA